MSLSKITGLSLSEGAHKGNQTIPSDAFTRLHRKLEPNGGCLEWKGYVDPVTGYGQIETTPDRRKWKVHRLAWELAHGPIPSGMVVCHHCDNRICCEPDHLFIGTQADNIADKVRKGRQARGEGHGSAKLTDDDVRVIRSTPSTVTSTDLASRFGISLATMAKVRRGDLWAHVL